MDLRQRAFFWGMTTHEAGPFTQESLPNAACHDNVICACMADALAATPV
jgi:hypothetical protein